MSTTKERVIIIGASDKPDRYSHKALLLLQKHGHEVVPVNPGLVSIESIPVTRDLAEVAGAVDTVTMYVAPKISSDLADKLIALKPRRVIFNPGSENPALQSTLAAAGIETQDACTLVLLRTGQY
jgi:uncharacterized protein